MNLDINAMMQNPMIAMLVRSNPNLNGVLGEIQGLAQGAQDEKAFVQALANKYPNNPDLQNLKDKPTEEIQQIAPRIIQARTSGIK